MPAGGTPGGWPPASAMTAHVDPAHPLPAMLRQRAVRHPRRVRGLQRPRHAPRRPGVFKLVAGRLPEDDPLASQPTLSRFENLPTPAALQRLIDFTVATGIERLKQEHGGALARLGHAGPGRHRRPDPRRPAAHALPRVLRAVPVLPPGRQRADDPARLPRLAAAGDGARLAGGRRRPDAGRERACGKSGPTSPSTSAPTPASACR